MKALSKLAIIGSGASAIFVLKHVLDRIQRLRQTIAEIHVFERDAVLGIGMPYNPNTTDRYNLCNISSAEIPVLKQPLVDWLASLNDTDLAARGIERGDIDDSEAYSRLVLGEYFCSQYIATADELRLEGIRVIEHARCEVSDVIDSPKSRLVTVQTATAERFAFDYLIIATGHAFDANDQPKAGYFSSPWPIHKLLPQPNCSYNFTIGTLGASLSAYDVVASLSNRHGWFEKTGHRLVFHSNADAEDFRIVLHSSNGWLPHLQYEQDEAFREIYRHTSRERMLKLRDQRGRLSLDLSVRRDAYGNAGVGTITISWQTNSLERGTGRFNVYAELPFRVAVRRGRVGVPGGGRTASHECHRGNALGFCKNIARLIRHGAFRTGARSCHNQGNKSGKDDCRN